MNLEQIVDSLQRGTPRPLRLAHEFEGVPGLYSIEQDGLLIYLGLSRNLKKRLKQHRGFNPRGSMFSYRYMLDHLKLAEPDCGTKQKNTYRQAFKCEYDKERWVLREEVLDLGVRTVHVPINQLHETERQALDRLMPKLNRCKR